MNRQTVEEFALRRANADTDFFWTQVARNSQINNSANNRKLNNNKARTEQLLFANNSEWKQGSIEDAIPVERSGPQTAEIGVLSAFHELSEKLPEFIMKNIELMKYDKPTPIQKHAVPFGLAGLDLMCCAQTGSGKTFAFLLPVINAICRPSPLFIEQASDHPQYSMQNEADVDLFFAPKRIRIDQVRGVLPRAVVLAPTRELASQIHLEARKLCHCSDLKTVCVYGGADIRSQLVELSTGCDLIVATPGRLTDLVDRGIVSLSEVEFLILDEADRMLDMGFEPQIRRLVLESDMPDKSQRQTFLFSATFPNEMQTLAREFLRDYVWIGVGRIGSTVDNITQEIVQASADPATKIRLLYDAVMRTEGRTLVFVQRKKTASWVCAYLTNQLGISAEEIHGDRSQLQREHALRMFRNGRIRVLVGTDVAARGLDIPAVTHVIQYDLPTSAEDFDTYVHRIGRTGRAGKSGLATAFFVPGQDAGEGNGRIGPLIMRLLKENQQDIPDWFANLDDNINGGRGGYKKTNKSGMARFGGRDVRSGYQTQSQSQFRSFAPPGQQQQHAGYATHQGLQYASGGGYATQQASSGTHSTYSNGMGASAGGYGAPQSSSSQSFPYYPNHTHAQQAVHAQHDPYSAGSQSEHGVYPGHQPQAQYQTYQQQQHTPRYAGQPSTVLSAQAPVFSIPPVVSNTTASAATPAVAASSDDLSEQLSRVAIDSVGQGSSSLTENSVRTTYTNHTVTSQYASRPQQPRGEYQPRVNQGYQATNGTRMVYAQQQQQQQQHYLYNNYSEYAGGAATQGFFIPPPPPPPPLPTVTPNGSPHLAGYGVGVDQSTLTNDSIAANHLMIQQQQQQQHSYAHLAPNSPAGFHNQVHAYPYHADASNNIARQGAGGQARYQQNAQYSQQQQQSSAGYASNKMSYQQRQPQAHVAYNGGSGYQQPSSPAAQYSSHQYQQQPVHQQPRTYYNGNSSASYSGSPSGASSHAESVATHTHETDVSPSGSGN